MRARSEMVVVVTVLAACGGAAKPHSNAAAPAAAPILPAPVAQSPTTSPPPAPDQPKPAEPDKVAIAEDPDAGGEVTDPDDGGEVAEGRMGGKGNGMRGSGAGGAGVGTTGGIGTGGYGAGAGGGTGQGYGGLGARNREPAGPSLRWGLPTVKGGLDPAIIRRVLRRNQNQLRYCYEQQLAKKPTLSGLLVLKVTIDADGKVATASSAGVNKELEACVTTRAKTWLFPKPQDGTVSVTQPITFVPAGT